MKQPTLRSLACGIVAIASLAGAVHLQADYPSTIAGLSPVGYYRLDETVFTPANLAINSGSAGVAADGYYIKDDPAAPIHPVSGALAGSADTAATFVSGTAQYVMVPFAPAINPLGSFTVEAWIMPTSDPAGLTSPLSFAHSGDPRSGWFIYQNNVAAQGWNFRMFTGVGLNRSLDISGGDVAVPGNWYHLAVTYDAGLNVVTLYVNGEAKASGSPVGYGPNADGNFTIGARSDGAFAYMGSLDEVALYAKPLAAAELMAHYQNGINPSPAASYDTLVMAQDPLLYYRLNEALYTPPAVLPVAANTGSWGANGNAGYEAGVVAGEPGPQYAGFPAGNKAARFNGAFGGVPIPAGQPLVTDSVSFAGWVKRDGPQSGWNAVVFQRGNVAATGFGFGDNNDLRVHWDDGEYPWVSGLLIPNGVWCFVAASYSPTQTILCVNGAFATNTFTHNAHDFSMDPIYIGLDSTGGRVVKGMIDEIAIFDKSLTPAQMTQLYVAAQVPPVISQQPQAPAGTVYEGMNVNLSVAAVGNATLTYQWRKGGGNLTGKTATTLALTNLTTAASGDYDVVVRNSLGAATSSIVTLTVVAGPPIIATPPAAAIRYPGGVARFTVSAVGSVPITYQWSRGVTPIPGATGATLTIPELSPTDAGDYTVTVTNPYGTRTATASLSLLPIVGKYETAVLGAGPIAFWRLNDAAGKALDAQGGYDATFTATVTTGQAGPRPVAEAGMEAGNNAFSFNGTTSDVIAPALNLNKNTMTIVVWVKPTVVQQDWAGLVFSRASGTVSGIDFRPGGVLGYTWDDAAATYNWDSGLFPVLDTWNLVALVVEPTKATMYLDPGTGLQMAENVDMTHAPEPFSGVTHFGTDPLGNRLYTGLMDEVAIYDRALSAQEIQTLRDAGFAGSYTPVAVSITQQPKSAQVMVGNSVALSAKATGSQPLTYQWQRNHEDVPGAVRSTLSFPSAAVSDSGTYVLKVMQGTTTIPSNPATLDVRAIPTHLDARPGLVLHLPFDGNYADSSDRGNHGTPVGGPEITAGKVGSGALRYSTVLSGGAVSSASYVSLGGQTDFAMGPGQDFSVSFWIKFTGVPGDLPFLGNTVNSYGDPGIDFAPSWEQGGWSWYISDASSSAWQGLGLYDPVQQTINNGAWHNLVHVFERSGDATTYLDGVKVHSLPIDGAATWDFAVSGQEWIIGQAQGGQYAVGGTFEMDDLGLWRRTLTPFEAQAIYIVGNLGRSFDVPAPAEVRMTITRNGDSITIGYASGVLESSSSPAGGWTTVGGASAPSHNVIIGPTTPTRFYRVRVN